MAFLWALLLGLVQGLTEFLPISSSAHLVLAEDLLGYRSPGVLVESVVHLATVLVTVVYFRRRLTALALGFWRPDAIGAAARRLVLMLALAFVVTSLAALAMQRWIYPAFENPSRTSVELMLNGVLLLSISRAPAARTDDIYRISWVTALLVGVAQAVSVFPGISRSGATMVTAMWMGVQPGAAAEFSFVLGVPTILAASLLGVWQAPDLGEVSAVPLLAAGVVAFVSGLLVVHWFMRWLRRGRLEWFAAYCFLIGGGYLLAWGVGWL